MRDFIGDRITMFGARLWENGGWTGDETYNDLKISGKIGFNLFMLGCKLRGISVDDINRIVTNRSVV